MLTVSLEIKHCTWMKIQCQMLQITLVHPFLVLQCLMLQITLVHPFLVQNVTNTRNELVASIKSNCQDNQHTR